MTRIPIEWIDRYFTGESTPDEAARVREWLSADASHRAFADALRASGDATLPIPTTRGAEATWERITQRTAIAAAPRPAAPTAPRIAQRPERSRFVRWAGSASVAAAAVLATVALMRMPSNTAAVPVQTYSTVAGQRASVTLSDSTKITLAPQTKLTVAFGPDERRITLSGQAYFEVAHVSGVPFIVHTGHVATRVVGTAFNVNAYPDDRFVHVGVLSGKVVSGVPERNALVLTAGMAGRLNDSTGVLVTDRKPDIGWTHGELVFRDTPIAEALATLSRWYGIDLRVGDSTMKTWHVHGTFAGDSRAEALANLQAALGVSMTYSGAPGQPPVITLVPKRGSANTDRRRERLQHFTETSREVGR